MEVFDGNGIPHLVQMALSIGSMCPIQLLHRGRSDGIGRGDPQTGQDLGNKKSKSRSEKTGLFSGLLFFEFFMLVHGFNNAFCKF